MGTGWRRAKNAALGLTVCTSIPRDELDALDSASPRTPKDNSGSPRLLAEESFSPRLENVSPTPRLQCRTSSSPRLRCQSVGNSPRFLSGSSHSSPRLQCRSTSSPKVRNIENVPLTEGSVPSSPRSPSRLSLLKNSIRLSRSTCGMCLQTMKPGQGHAIFTAECSHAFHFPCIASNVKHGNLVCPVCRAKWKEVPSQVSVKKEEKAEKTSVLTPRSSSRRNASLTSFSEDYRRLDRNAEEEEEESSSFTPRGGSRQITAPPSEALYDDDEPLDRNYPRPNISSTFSTILEEEEEFEFKGFVVEPEEPPAPAPAPRNNRPGFGNSKSVEVTIHPEVEVLAAGKSCETFAVLLQVKAPPASSRQLKNAKRNSPSLILDPNCRAPIDLVTVLDVSGSMSGTKLQLLKRAMRLVISSLSPSDRLSVVAFSATAKRIFPLKRMVPQGQRAARRVIDRLICGEGTNISDGLKKAAKILQDRRQRNPVASIMLLSDGQDEHSLVHNNRPSFPSSIRQSTRYGHVEIPVHAFGFGSDHDSAKMHAISENSGGTFSYIQAEDSVHDAFAQCIGGLLSVVVQDVQLTVSCCSIPGVEINKIYAGGCQTRLLDDYGTVKLGNLYAEEDREIVLELKIPAVRYPYPMNVLCVSCSFKDPVTQQVAYGNEQFLTIPRPESVRGYPSSASLKVEKCRIKLRTAQAISEARTVADRGDAIGAQQILYNAKFLLQSSDASRTIDGLRSALDAEISRIQSRNCSRERQRSRRTAESETTTSTTPSVLDIIMRYQTDSNGEPLTPTSAWRAAEKLAKVAMMRKSLNRVSDLHGFENARF